MKFETPVVSSKYVDKDNDVEVDEENDSDEIEAPALLPSKLTESIVVRRPRRDIHKPVRFIDMVAYALPIVEDDIPSTCKEAMHTCESGEWKKAMDEETKSLHKNQT